MMTLVTSRGTSNADRRPRSAWVCWAAPIVAVLAIGLAGCAESPDEPTSGIRDESGVEVVGEGVSELDVYAPGSKASGAEGARTTDLPPPAEGLIPPGRPGDAATTGGPGRPGADRQEPDPVPWTSRRAMANEA